MTHPPAPRGGRALVGFLGSQSLGPPSVDPLPVEYLALGGEAQYRALELEVCERFAERFVELRDQANAGYDPKALKLGEALRPAAVDHSPEEQEGCGPSTPLGGRV